jgi:Outer membrane protein beta-barrel domain
MTGRRILIAALFAALLPVAASAQSRGVASTSSPGTSGSFLLGMEDFSGDTGLALRFDGVMDVKYLAPKVKLSGVVSLGFMHWGDSASYSYGLGTEQVESSLNIFKLVPAARFTFDIAPSFDLYADAGLGFYYARANAKDTITVPGYITQVTEGSGSDTGIMMRFAGGATFNVSPSFKLGAELGLNPYFGDISDNSFTLMALAQFRM